MDFELQMGKMNIPFVRRIDNFLHAVSSNYNLYFANIVLIVLFLLCLAPHHDKWGYRTVGEGE